MERIRSSIARRNVGSSSGLLAPSIVMLLFVARRAARSMHSANSMRAADPNSSSPPLRSCAVASPGGPMPAPSASPVGDNIATLTDIIATLID
jgi:hypothetical protein